MLVERTKIKETNHFKVGDIIRFKLNNGEEIKAMAIKEFNTNKKGMLFVALDCINETRPMFNKDPYEKMSYHNSDLRKFLNEELFLEFPKEIQELMLPVYALDKIRIPSEMEIFGENKCGRKKDELDGKYWEIMSKERNRVALRYQHRYFFEGYWLMNRKTTNNTDFAIVNLTGDIGQVYGFKNIGVRPVFRLLNEDHD